ncbi:MAG: DoxX family protein [Aquaticitalea sp.]
MEAIDYLVIALKVIVGFSILNVWLIQPTKPTKWRGGNATTIIEEFKVYGLSKTMCYIVGFLKVSLALLLLASIKFEKLTPYASSGLALLLFGSIIMHIKIKDPLYKSVPATIFLLMTILLSVL